MKLTEIEWQDRVGRLRLSRDAIRELPPDLPNPVALRCEFSRHRTLAHLRACQETWLEAAIAFSQRDRVSLTLLHPWRLFEACHYESEPWEDHLSAFLTDRDRWIELVSDPALDRGRGGKLNRNERTIEGLTDLLVHHEIYHLELVGLKVVP